MWINSCCGQTIIPNQPNVRVWVCGRKPEYLEKTDSDTGRTCKLHTELGQKPVRTSMLHAAGPGVGNSSNYEKVCDVDVADV